MGLLVLTFSWTGCRPEKSVELSAPELPAVTVSLAEARIEENIIVDQIVGTVTAKLQSKLSSKISGRITEFTLRIGQRVLKDDLLVSLNSAEVEARLEMATAARDQTAKELVRYKELLDQNAATQSEYDAVESRHRMAEASAREAEAIQEYTQILAPFDGVVARKFADIGDLASPGKPLLELEGLTGFRFEANVPEALASRIQIGQVMEVRVDSVGKAIPAEVSEMAPSANPLSRTLLVKLDFPKNKELRSGQYGRLAVMARGPSNVRIPADALIQRGQMEIVFVATEGHALLRLVKTGKRSGKDVEILSGLDAGERVVIEGASALRDRQPIAVK